MSTDQIATGKPAPSLPVRAWHIVRGCWRIGAGALGPVLRLLFGVTIVAYFVFGAVLLGVRYLVLPNINAYKPQIELLAERAIGNPVSINGVAASWSGLQPRLALDTVVIHGSDGKAALTLPRIDATLSWWSVLAAELRLEQLVIDRPDLEVTRDAQGRLFVAGIEVGAGGDDDGRGLDWVLSQKEIRIRDGRIRWNDTLRGAPELALADVGLLVRNRWRTHRFALQARPPAELAAPLDVRAAFEHPPFAGGKSNFSRWRGELFLDVREADLAGWRAWFDYPFELQSARGSVRAWLDFNQARVADFTADLGLWQVSARLNPELEPLRLESVRGRISVRETLDVANDSGVPTLGANGHAISLTDFSMRTEDGLYMPPTTIRESYAPARDGMPARTEFHALAVDLETLADFAERLPLPADQRRMLADFAPRGVVRDFSAQWQGSYPDVSSYNVRGGFERLTLNHRAAQPARVATANAPAHAAMPAIPGFANLTGRIEANERGGMLDLASRDAMVQLPAWFARPAMPFQRLDAQASWSLQGKEKLLVDVREFAFVQDEIEGMLKGRHVLPLTKAGALGTIDMSGRIKRARIDHVGRYLPLQTPSSLRSWLTGALLGGSVEDVQLKIRGDLAHFPFRAGPDGRTHGEFRIAGRIVDGRLNYAPEDNAPVNRKPEWPLIEKIQGTIAFERERMDIRAESATSSGATLSKVKVAIPDLAADEPVLTVDGEAAGPLQQFVRFTHDSPVGAWIGDFTKPTTASGNARLSLKLHLPLDDLDKARVNGALHFSGNTVQLMAELPPLSAATGTLEFDENGFTLNNLRSSFLGGPVAISGGTRRDGSIQVRAEGTVTAAGLRQVYQIPRNALGGERVTGSTRYGATIRVRDGHPEVTVESSLNGLGLDFPEPLRKVATDNMPLRFELKQSPSSDSMILRDRIMLSLGTTIHAHYERERPAASDARWRVISGGIGVNAVAPQPDAGVHANFNVSELNIDAWRNAASSVAGARPGTSAARFDRAALAQYVEPQVLAARATELVVMDRKLRNVVVGASHEKDLWQVNIDSDQISGYVSWTEPSGNRSLGRIKARLSSLVIPEAAEPEVAELLEGKDDAERLPALDIVAENFVLFGRPLGSLELNAAYARGPEGREWRIGKLNLSNPAGELSATGKWSGRAGASHSTLDYSLNIRDAGNLLERLGFGNLLSGGQGRMEGNLNWNGSPLAFDIPSLSGEVRLDLERGQFLKVDAASQGAAKLLGVLSLQSLPRRLTLDFRDVFSEGFAFDGVQAAAAIRNGVVKTENFKMRGVSATVLIDGSADIARENQDLHVVIIPEINAGAASVVYGLAVNPAIGVGTFLAQLFLREPLMKAFTYEYQVTGPWKEPVVTRLTRKQGEGVGQAKGEVKG